MNTDKQTKIIIALVIIIGIMLVGLCYLVFSHQDAPKVEVKNTTANDTLIINKTTN